MKSQSTNRQNPREVTASRSIQEMVKTSSGINRRQASATRRPAGKKLAVSSPVVSPEALSSRAKMATRKTAAAQTLVLPVVASGVTAQFGGMAGGIEVTAREASTSTRTLKAGRSGKPRLLWIGDAVVPTGFATVTHAVLGHLCRDWEVGVSGVNYDGNAHAFPYEVVPALQGADMWGLDHFQKLCAEFDPAVVVINNDPWNVAKFVRLAPAGVKVVGYMPVDGGNQDPADMRTLSRLHAAVWYTRFGHGEAVKAGFQGAQHIIPHGIDIQQFHPMARDEARRILDLNVPKNAFIVGNLNRNQPRKRLDLTTQIFAAWIRKHHLANTFLLLHCAQKDIGWDLRRVAAFHGVADRLLLTGGESIRELQSTRHLQLIYSSLDVQMTTTMGEGWGLTTMEGMACGVPQIVPDSSALGEWALPAVKVPCSRTLMHAEINTTGMLVDEAPFVDALHSLYGDKARRQKLSAAGLALVRQDEFRWQNVAHRFHQILVSRPGRKIMKKTKARALLA